MIDPQITERLQWLLSEENRAGRSVDALDRPTQAVWLDDLRTILAALSTPSGEPEVVKRARDRLGKPPAVRSAFLPEDVITAYEAGLRASQTLRPALPEDVRASAQAVVDAVGQTLSGQWVIHGDGEVLMANLAAALERQAETQP